jgi:hypothetical protein
MIPESPERAARNLTLGAAYVSAARGVLATPDFAPGPPPVYRRLGHGMELCRKSVVARAGWDDERLMWLGHDLARAWRVAQPEPAPPPPHRSAPWSARSAARTPPGPSAIRRGCPGPRPDPPCARARPRPLSTSRRPDRRS